MSGSGRPTLGVFAHLGALVCTHGPHVYVCTHDPSYMWVGSKDSGTTLPVGAGYCMHADLLSSAQVVKEDATLKGGTRFWAAGWRQLADTGQHSLARIQRQVCVVRPVWYVTAYPNLLHGLCCVSTCSALLFVRAGGPSWMPACVRCGSVHVQDGGPNVRAGQGCRMCQGKGTSSLARASVGHSSCPEGQHDTA